MKKLLVSTIIIWSIFSTSFAADLKDIEVLNNWNINISTTEDLLLEEWELSWDLKILKDYEISFSYKDIQDSKKVILNLRYDLDKNKNYTILWIDWAEANFIFKTSDKITGEYTNNEEKDWLKILKINIIDSKTIEIYYSEEITAEEFTYKLLSEIPTKSKTVSWENKINVTLSSPLEEEKKYIILSNFIKNKSWENIKMDEYIYDFQTKENLENIFEKETEEKDINLDKKEEEKWNIEEVAKNMKKTPTTWAKTWFIFLLALAVAFTLFWIKFKKKILK